jgi:hypothetical protein
MEKKKTLKPLPLGTTPLERKKKPNPSLIIFTYNLISPHSTLERKKLTPKHITLFIWVTFDFSPLIPTQKELLQWRSKIEPIKKTL